MQQFRELVFGFRSAGVFNACLQQLWYRIFSCRCFPGSFLHWLLSNDIADFVPQSPSLDWFQQALDNLLLAERHWCSVVESRKRAATTHFRNDDWSSGGRWHAAAVKPPAAASLTALVRATTLQAKPLRTTRQAPASFRVVSSFQSLLGDAWQISGQRCKVIKQQVVVVGSIALWEISRRSVTSRMARPARLREAATSAQMAELERRLRRRELEEFQALLNQEPGDLTVNEAERLLHLRVPSGTVRSPGKGGL